MNQLRIALLGQPKLYFNDKPLHATLLQKSQALLYYLAIEGQTQPRDLLAGLLWSDMPQANARVNLRTALARLRGEVGDLVTATRTHVTLHEAVWCDSAEFLQNQTTTDLPTLQKTHTLYRGDFLTGFSPPDAPLFEEWTILQRERLRQTMYDGTLRLVEMLIESGKLSEAIVHARRLIVLDDLREVGHRTLIDLLARNGNRVAALTQFEQLRTVLMEELGVEPSGVTLEMVGRLREEPSPPAPLPKGEGSKRRTPILHNFPAIASSFHGRAEEIRQILEMLKQPDCRLLTLVGMGGVGKTRLAIEAVARLGEQHGSCWFIPLTAVNDREEIVNAFVQTLGLMLADQKPREEQLFTYLREKNVLFVLDNFEQLVSDASLLSDLLRRCPNVKLVVTTRERLKLYEEWLLPVVGLQVASHTLQGDVSEAVQLFVQRARQQDMRFALAKEREAVQAICERVEGLPLGIELAAVWTGMLSCAEIAAEIGQLTTPLANLPARQRSLQAIFDYSWQLLNGEERRTLAQLTVFRGGFSADAALAITQCSRLTLLSLVEKSLVQHGENRFDLHAMVRELAAKHLVERDALEAKHRAWYADIAQRAAPQMSSAEQTATYNRLRDDEANLLLAWRSSNEQRDVANFAKMLDGMSFYFMTGGRYREGYEWMRECSTWLLQVGAHDHLIGRTLIRTASLWQHANHGSTEPDAMLERALKLLGEDVKERGRAYYGLGYSSMFRGAYQVAELHLEDAIAAAESADDQHTLGDALQTLAYLQTRRGEREQALQLAERAVAIHRALGGFSIASSLTTLGNLYNNANRHDEAQAIFEEVLERSQAVNHLVGIASALTGLFVAAYRKADFESAKQYGKQSLSVYQEAGDLWGVAVGQHNMAALLAEQGDERGAKELYRKSAETYEQINANSTGLANSLSAWGKMAIKLGEFTEARQVLRRALRLAQQLDSLRFIGKALLYFAQLTAAEGNRAEAAAILVHVLENEALTADVQEEAERLREEVGDVAGGRESAEQLIAQLLT